MILKNLLKSILPVTRNLSYQGRSVVIRTSQRCYHNIVSQTHLKVKSAVFGVTACVTIYFVYVQDNVQAGEQKKKLVILGSGWGAVSLIKSLKPGIFDITVISPTNYFLFTPLLPSVTVGTVDGRTLVEPIRKIINKRHKSDAQYFEAECTDIDTDKKKIICVDKSGLLCIPMYYIIFIQIQNY